MTDVLRKFVIPFVRVFGIALGIWIVVFSGRDLLISSQISRSYWLFSIGYSHIGALPLIVPWQRIRMDFVWLLLFVLLCVEFVSVTGLTVWQWHFLVSHPEACQLSFPTEGVIVTSIVAVQIPAVLFIRRHRLSFRCSQPLSAGAASGD